VSGGASGGASLPGSEGGTFPEGLGGSLEAGASNRGGSGATGCDESFCIGLGRCYVGDASGTCPRTCQFDASPMTDEDVEALAALRCDVLDGTLQVDSRDVSSLAGLETIRVVTGSVLISRTTAPDLSGLSGLSRVGGALEVHQNDTNLAVELPALSAVVGQLTFVALPSLDHIFLPALNTVGGLMIVACDALTELKADALQATTGGLNVALNPKLSTLHGLPALTSIEGSISVRKNPALAQCEVDDVLVRAGRGCDGCDGNDATAVCP
jgi:hypothetical protein